MNEADTLNPSCRKLLVCVALGTARQFNYWLHMERACAGRCQQAGCQQQQQSQYFDAYPPIHARTTMPPAGAIGPSPVTVSGGPRALPRINKDTS